MSNAKEASIALTNLYTMVSNLAKKSGIPLMIEHDIERDHHPDVWIERAEYLATIIDMHLKTIGYAIEIRRAYDGLLDEAEMNRLIGMLEFSGAMIPGVLLSLCEGLRATMMEPTQ